MGRPSNAAEKRRQIANALLECMKHASYYEVSTRDIAKAADMPPSLVYHYFDTKKDILMELLCIEHDTFTETRTQWIQDHALNLRSIDELIDLYMQRMEELVDDKHYHYLVAYASLWSIGNYDEDVKKANAEFYIESREAHAEVLRRYLVDPSAADELAMMIISMMDSYVYGKNVFLLSVNDFLSMHHRFLQLFRLYEFNFQQDN